MSYRVVIRPSAERDLARIDPSHRRRLAAKIDALTQNPRPNGCVKLTGSAALWRVRVGDYRIVYSISDVVQIVEIIHVAHRREIYRGLP